MTLMMSRAGQKQYCFNSLSSSACSLTVIAVRLWVFIQFVKKINRVSKQWQLWHLIHLTIGSNDARSTSKLPLQLDAANKLKKLALHCCYFFFCFTNQSSNDLKGTLTEMNYLISVSFWWGMISRDNQEPVRLFFIYIF